MHLIFTLKLKTKTNTFSTIKNIFIKKKIRKNADLRSSRCINLGTQNAKRALHQFRIFSPKYESVYLGFIFVDNL